jgi:hypothetical protein
VSVCFFFTEDRAIFSAETQVMTNQQKHEMFSRLTRVKYLTPQRSSSEVS